ncbi:MAG: TlpA family protein disulfide reductase [Planctomycetes bacterium]|nr:TlpA family protein disulfide reductase [Planctomycetota bacterium]MCB9891257.1 TlpA family protein disulfide reductase [Planctomycetota bacterium]MCB9919484.1 TlpA family protein disulfide reductase [Planctomycetota bacterium]
MQDSLLVRPSRPLLVATVLTLFPAYGDARSQSIAPLSAQAASLRQVGQDEKPAQPVERPTFELDIETLDGDKLTNATLHDKVVLIDFWGTWCPPCKKAIPHLVKLYEKYESKGLVILGLNYEKGDDPIAQVRAFADKNGIQYPLAIGTEALQKQVQDFGGFPTMLFFRRGMRLDRKETGFTEDKVAAIEAWVTEALEEDVPDGEATPEQKSVRAELVHGTTKLAIGDGTHVVMLVVTHPRSKPDEVTLARLRELAASQKDLVVATIGFQGVEGTEADFLVDAAMLEQLGLGHAAPAFRLFDKTGRASTTEVGRGDKVHATVLAAVEALAVSKATDEVPPATKPASKNDDAPAKDPKGESIEKPAEAPTENSKKQATGPATGGGTKNVEAPERH